MPQVFLFCREALDLAAGGFRQSVGSDEGDGVHLDLMDFGNSLAQGFIDGFRIQVAQVGAADLTDQDQPLFARFIHGKCRYGTALQRFMGAGRRVLDIMRIMIQPADDDEILDPSGDIQMPVVNESQVAGAEKRAFACVGHPGPEGSFGLLRLVPVTFGHRWTGNPYFPHLTGRIDNAGLRMDDFYRGSLPGIAATDKSLCLRAVSRQQYDLSLFNLPGID